MLFHKHIFGPIISRRLGVSLGINLLPNEGKICSFDCIYCECGFNKDGRADTRLASREELRADLAAFLNEYAEGNNRPINTITFAGNGEPTLHPEFEGIVDDTLALRNQYAPEAQVSVLTNAWHLDKPEVVRALRKVDNCMLKLDSAIPETVAKLNRPVNPHFDLDRHIDQLASFGKSCIVQTLFVRGAGVDNTTDEEVSAWIKALVRIAPRQVQLYPIDRKTPMEGLEKVPVEELRSIAAKVEKLGIETQVIG